MAGADPTPPGGESHRLFTLPNIITLARLAAVPATVWLVLHQAMGWAFIVFAAAGVSDGLDGWIARAWNQRSALGAMLDPVADKALLISIYIVLAIMGGLPDWLAILVVTRDVFILGGLAVLWFLGIRPPIAPLYISKVNTFTQIALAGFALLQAGFGMGPDWVLQFLIWSVACSTLVSGAAYLAGGARLLAAGPGQP